MTLNSDNSNQILIIGNCTVDQVMQVDSYPQEDAEVRALSHERRVGGNACNTARILASLGVPVRVLSSLASDPDGDWILEQLQVSGVDTDSCPRMQGQSPLSTIWLNRRTGSRTIVHYRDLAELTLDQLAAVTGKAFTRVHFEGRNTETLARFLHEAEFSADTKCSLELEKRRPDMELLLPFMDLVVVSSAYLRQTGQTTSQCFESLKRINPQVNIVCTLGSNGVAAMDVDGQRLHLAAEPVPQVLDSIGAGDCFIAGLLRCLLRQQALEEAMVFANKLAANFIQQQGIRVNV